MKKKIFFPLKVVQCIIMRKVERGEINETALLTLFRFVYLTVTERADIQGTYQLTSLNFIFIIRPCSRMSSIFFLFLANGNWIIRKEITAVRVSAFLLFKDGVVSQSFFPVRCRLTIHIRLNALFVYSKSRFIM